MWARYWYNLPKVAIIIILKLIIIIIYPILAYYSLDTIVVNSQNMTVPCTWFALCVLYCEYSSIVLQYIQWTQGCIEHMYGKEYKGVTLYVFYTISQWQGFCAYDIHFCTGRKRGGVSLTPPFERCSNQLIYTTAEISI